MKKTNKFIYTIIGLVILLQPTTISADSTTQEASTANIISIYNPSNSNNAITQKNPFFTTLTTVYGNAGVSKVWSSGGSIWFSIKLYNYLAYNWKGNLHIAFSNGKTRNYIVGGVGYIGETWTDHQYYLSVGKHGKATLTGTAVSVDGRKASVLSPYTSF